jgi:beta-lactam-binding protein with PASTA domain
MNNLQRASVILIAGFLLCILFLNSSMAQAPTKSSENIKTEIIMRSMTARESQNFDKQLNKENQKKSSGQKVLDTLSSSGANASYGSADAIIDVAKKNKSYLIENSKKALNKIVKKSATVKSIVSKSGGSIKKALKGLDGLDKAGTGGSFLGAVAGKDPVGAGESLLNAAGSGYFAASGGKFGMAIGSMIAPGPGTVIGGFIGAFAGALTYNEVVAPQVEKAGDYASNKIASGEAQINNKRLKIKREIKKNFDTVYPHGYLGSYTKDPLTGMIYELRPDVLYQKAEKIRQANKKKFNEKLDQEIQKITKKNDWQFTPEKTKPAKQTAFKAKKAVPDVKNKSLKTAFNILKNAGFILGSPEGGDPAPSKKLVGHVQMQLPAGGQPQYQNIPIVLTLYSDIEIPDVVGMTADKALEKLKKAGFSMAPEGCDPPPTKDFSLLAKEQKPAAYTPGKGYDTVTVTFYPEFQSPVVPGITTLKFSKAQGLLEEMGLSLSPDLAWGEQAATRKQVGKIQKQQPAEGEPIEPGGEVKAWVYYTVVPKVLTMSKNNAESAMKAAWFVPNSTKGEAVKNKNKWGTIYSQTLQPEKKFAETDMKVTLKYYTKPAKKKKSSDHPLVGAWKVNTIEHSRANLLMKKDRKNNRYIKIQSVDHNGNFKGFYINSGEDDKYKLLGTLNGNKIFFHCTLPKAWYAYKYNGILNTQQMTIKGSWSYQCIVCDDSSWQLNVGPFYMKKK